MGRVGKTLMTLLVGVALAGAADGRESGSSIARTEPSDSSVVVLQESAARKSIGRSRAENSTEIITPPEQKSTWTKIKGLFM